MDDEKFEEAEKRIAVLETTAVNLMNAVIETQNKVQDLTEEINELRKTGQKKDAV